MIRVSPGCISMFWLMSPSLIRSFSLTVIDCLLAVRIAPNDFRAVAGGVFCQALGGDHDVQQRHVVAVGYRGRVGRLADDPDLTVGRTDEGADDHGDVRILDVFLQPLLDLAGELGRCLARRHDVLDQRRRDPAVGPHRDATVAEIGIAIDEDAERSPDPITY